ncbi:MAG: crossover junction endodeoxyribonuclease RuvC [Nitrospirae bacterium]|nr:crossover junction endodeoxyribonuclease RuvC [Nitrospirota bacterium]
MNIIGIDPGTVCCGYGILSVNKKPYVPKYVASGDIRMSSKKPLPERLHILYGSLKDIILEHRPSHLCMEKVFYHKSIRSSMALGTTRGVVMLLAAQHGMPLFEYNPTEVKMALTGYGRAEKRQVQEMVLRILNLEPSLVMSEDTSDALALTICHINSSFELK